MKQKQGFALIIVLLWLTLISLLAIDALEANLIETQLTAHDWQRRHIKVIAETQLQKIETLTQQQEVPCQIPILDSQTIMYQPHSWWEEASCTGNYSLFEYYYVVEIFSLALCARIEQDEPGRFKKVSLIPYRITLLVENRNNPMEKVMLQSHMLKLGAENTVCHDTTRTPLQPGRQSWREYQ